MSHFLKPAVVEAVANLNGVNDHLDELKQFSEEIEQIVVLLDQSDDVRTDLMMRFDHIRGLAEVAMFHADHMMEADECIICRGKDNLVPVHVSLSHDVSIKAAHVDCMDKPEYFHNTYKCDDCGEWSYTPECLNILCEQNKPE